MTGDDFYKWRQDQAGVDKGPRGVKLDHMSQQEAAEHFGVTRQTIINWEQGHTPIPKSVELATNA